jgi:hypothetical protein
MSPTRTTVGALMAARPVRLLLALAYALVLIVVLTPVLAASVGADDSYWVLRSAPDAGGSVWNAYWNSATHAFNFEGQPRTTSLATSERRVLAVIALNVAATFSVSPVVVWFAVKVALLLAGVGAVALFLWRFRFRGADGTTRGLTSQTVAFMVIFLPAVVAIGAKAQDVASLNGWLHYPTLAYGPIVVYFLAATLVLEATRLIARGGRRWIVPVVLSMAVVAVYVNLSYELIALTIPVALLAILFEPLPEGPAGRSRWMPKIVVGGSLAVIYLALFAWIRWRLSQMACNVDGSCYAGTVIEVRPRTLVNNFAGALPGGTAEFVSRQAIRAGRAMPEVTIASILLGALVVLLALLLWQSTRAGRAPASGGDDRRGLARVVAIAVVVALGGAAISGITANAVVQLQTSMLSYRSGVLIWTAVALVTVAVVRMVALSRVRALRAAAICALCVVVVVAIGLYFPRNVLSAQLNRSTERTLAIDALHREVALGDPKGDERRCSSITAFIDTFDEVLPRVTRTIEATYLAYAFYHDEKYCITGVGRND